VFTDPLSIETTVSVSGTGSYTFRLELLNAACLGFTDLTVEVLESPEITVPQEICDGTGSTYTLTFQVTGGALPYSANIPGSFAGGTFTSDPIPSGEAYAVIVTDANGCESISLTGDRFCDCVTTAGVMEPMIIEFCGPEGVAQSTQTVSPTLDPDDILVFYLHTSPTSTLGAVLDSNLTGTFAFLPGMELDSVYYISAVVGNAAGGFVDTGDPCLDIASGQPVIWYSFPEVQTGVIGSTCGDTLVLTQSPPGGIWNFVSSPPNSILFVLNLSDSTTTIAPDSSGEYVLTWTASNTAGCSATDTLTFFKLPTPELINQQTTCSPDLSTYTFSFEITNDTGPYFVNGEPSGPLYTSQPIPVDSVATFTVLSGSGCETPVEVGPVNCACSTDAGSISGIDQVICVGEASVLPQLNGDAQLNDDDTIAWLLHDGSLTGIGNILQISYGTPFLFGDPLIAGQPYVVTVVAAASQGGMIQLEDPCLDTAGSVTVTWLSVTTVSVDTTITACQGDTVSSTIAVSGAYPVEVLLVSDLSDTLLIQLNSSMDEIVLPADRDTQIWTLIDAIGACVSNAGGQIVVIGQRPLDLNLTDGVEICNTAAFGSKGALADLYPAISVPGLWSATGLTITNDTLDATGVFPGTYTLTFDTRGFEGVCPGSIYTTEITVIDCACPPVDLPANIAVCNGDAPVDLSALIPSGLNGIWSIGNPENHPLPPTISTNLLEISDRDAGSYP
ncbi:MAG: hypothetical protein R3330_07280, partial [Saprospiraceae bacterium]|nr:hypothetical protein [Saprospiraceae bacterium]